ncbi:MAG: hypothetical protein VB026_04600, partial [Anaerolineaceae bacterium]|nr:hypothetical protein [Anaerolineaceae bacterium]
IPTTAKQTEWDTAYTNNHTHANKTVLDGITSTNVSNWNSAYSWGDHAGLYLPLGGGTVTGNITAPTFTGNLVGNANTATSLATARTINGTSFNGTADITTANWGTSRNITLGNTTRSVNGSTTYTWTHADIGATNLLSLSGDVLSSTVNGVLATTSISSILPATTNTLSSSNNILTSNVNGVVSTTSAVNTHSLEYASGVFTSTVNGVTATTSLAGLQSTTTNTITFATNTNTLTSTVNGVVSTASLNYLKLKYYSEPSTPPATAPLATGVGSLAIGDGARALGENIISVGTLAGTGVTFATSSNFFGYGSGYQATNAYHSNFYGSGAGFQSTNAFYSNFFGINAGYNAPSADSSNFFGRRAGDAASNASNSNFFGYYAGRSASNASFSNLFGYQAGMTFAGNNLGSNNIIIGTNISLPNATANSMNIGGVLFGTGFQSDTTATNPYTTPVAGGKIGIGTSTPEYRLTVQDTANPLQLVGLQAGTSTDQILSVDGSGVVRRISASSLQTSITNNFLAENGLFTSMVNGVLATSTADKLFTFHAYSSNLSVSTSTGGNVAYTLTDTPTFSSISTTNLNATNATATNLFTNSFRVVGTSTFEGDLIPAQHNTYALGSPTSVWKDAYIGPGSLYINGKKVLQDISNVITFSTDIDQNLVSVTSGTGNNTIRARDFGNVSVLTDTGNLNINSSSGLINIGTTGSGYVNMGSIKSGTWNASRIDISDYTNLAVASSSGLALVGDTIGLDVNYKIPFSASTTEWSSFYTSPSSRVTAGAALSWNGNTLNVDTSEILNQITTTHSLNLTGNTLTSTVNGVTATSALALPFSSLTNTPTTLTGYGITDAMNTSH